MKTCMTEVFGRHRHRWKENTETDLIQTGWDSVEWIYLAQYRKK
jgi:aryl carrier-like protein